MVLEPTPDKYQPITSQTSFPMIHATHKLGVEVLFKPNERSKLINVKIRWDYIV